MELGDAHAPGATPLDPDEAGGLIPSHISTQAQLNEWEEANILEARRWVFARRRRDVLTEEFARELHRRMFDKTWKWAGDFRRSGKNIGVDSRQISTRLRDLLDDARYWIEHRTYPIDEIAARFHHRLVSIHPFANGNGRHARLMADVLLVQADAPPFTWGSKTLVTGAERETYIAVLHAADAGDIKPLLRFSRS